ncbi:MAG: hypothetical protein [Caudoviricetes sp.]|nr:MAG: hypothetical protein [Caudoviricetes sp.]
MKPTKSSKPIVVKPAPAKKTDGIPVKPKLKHGGKKLREVKPKPQPEGFTPANAVKKGEQLWKLANYKSRFQHFPEGSAQLIEAAAEYFQWCVDHPLYETQLIAYQGVGVLKEVPKVRAFTYSGLFLYLGITSKSYWQWQHGEARPDLYDACKWIDEAMREQKFTAASAGLLNAGLIARDLGLAEKTEVTGANGGPVETITTTMTPEEAAERYRQTREQLDDK